MTLLKMWAPTPSLRLAPHVTQRTYYKVAFSFWQSFYFLYFCHPHKCRSLQKERINAFSVLFSVYNYVNIYATYFAIELQVPSLQSVLSWPAP